MNAKPRLDDLSAAPVAAPALAPVEAGAEGAAGPAPEKDLAVGAGEGVRRFSVYQPQTAFGLIEELDHLTRRAIDGNVFFAPQFLIPAMPRLDERSVRLMVMRDEGPGRSRLRLLMPFSVERAGLFGGLETVRTWTHPFGPLGTLPLDADDPEESLASFLSALARPDLGLPDILVLPDLRLDEPMAAATLRVAGRLGLPCRIANLFDRAALVKEEITGDWFRDTLSPKRRRDHARQGRLLAAGGPLSFETARRPEEVRLALEEFLLLEASGWKGRERSAMLLDRFRAAFAREAVNKLAAEDRARVFTLRLASEPVASLVAFVLKGEAFAWKMAYDEAWSKASPGLQLMVRATEALLADPDVRRADSCAVPDHFLMNRVWKGRIRIGTLVVALRPGADRKVALVASSLEKMRKARNLARLMRERLRSMLPFG